MNGREPFGAARAGLVRLDELEHDPRFNRPISENAVNRIMADFQPRAFRSIIVSKRDNGYVVIDGQHRVEAAKRYGISQDQRVIPALIHEGLTLPQEAELFELCNRQKIVNPIDRHHARLAAEQPQALDIERIVRKHGLRIGGFGGDGHLTCAAKLNAIYELDDGVTLDKTLYVLTKAWGPLKFGARVIGGVGLYLAAHPEADADELATALVEGPGIPAFLVGWARAMSAAQNMALDAAIAQVIESRVLRPRRKARSA